MTKKRIFYAGFIFCILLLGSFESCQLGSIYFRSPAVSATVVDKQTGKPVAGVKVAVRWSAMRSTANEHNPDCMDLQSINVTTDSNGVFTVPAWGPVAMAWGWFYFSTDPEITFPSPGHYDEIIHNSTHEGFDEIQPWPWQTVTFEIPSWNGHEIPR